MNGARYMAVNFTSVNFGWNIYLAPTPSSDGYQPDMYEFVCSRGAAWDSPISLVVTSPDELINHPRTEDNLAVIKKWEEARIANLFTDEQKEMLKDPYQEHILLKIDGNHELLPYKKVPDFASGDPDVSAFLFIRDSNTWVVYWHKNGAGQLEIPISGKAMKVYNREMTVEDDHTRSGSVQILPIDNRRYLAFDLPEREVIEILRRSKIIEKHD